MELPWEDGWVGWLWKKALEKDFGRWMWRNWEDGCGDGMRGVAWEGGCVGEMGMRTAEGGWLALKRTHSYYSNV